MENFYCSHLKEQSQRMTLMSIVDSRNIKWHADTTHPYGLHAVILIPGAKDRLKVTEGAIQMHVSDGYC
jgi:hypothetical protein